MEEYIEKRREQPRRRRENLKAKQEENIKTDRRLISLEESNLQ
jgi:hypothetical protein